MSKKTIVLTVYGTGKVVTDCMVTLFIDEEKNHYDDESPAYEYCSSINELELKEDCWIHAFIVNESQKVKLYKPILPDINVLGTLDNWTVQKVIDEVDNDVLAKALINSKKETIKAVLRNKSKRSARIIFEDMKRIRPLVLKDVKEAQRKVALAIQRLEREGEIVVPKSSLIE